MKTTHKIPFLVSMLLYAAFGVALTRPAFGQLQEAWSVPVPLFASNVIIRAGSDSIYVNFNSSAYENLVGKYAAIDGYQLWLVPLQAASISVKDMVVDSADNVYVCRVFGVEKLAASDGHQMWLVPSSEAIKAILLDSADNVYINKGRSVE